MANKFFENAYYYKINLKDLIYIKSIFESYEGIAIVRTLNSKQGIIAIIFNDFHKNDVIKILENLLKEITMIKLKDSKSYNIHKF